MNMNTYFNQPAFLTHLEVDHYRKALGYNAPLDPGVVRQGMLQFHNEIGWGGPYPGNTAHFLLLDQRVWSNKDSGPTLAAARDEALERMHGWLAGKPRDRKHYERMLQRLEAWDADVIHQVTERGTQEYPIRIWCMGTDDTSYSKWFQTVEDAENLLTLLESFENLDFATDFLAFDWTFTN